MNGHEWVEAPGLNLRTWRCPRCRCFTHDPARPAVFSAPPGLRGEMRTGWTEAPCEEIVGFKAVEEVMES